MDNQDAPRKLKLKLFAEQCLERLTNKEPGYTDFQAMQDIYIQAAKLSGNDVDAFMDDLFDVLVGHMSLAGIFKAGTGEYAVGNQNLIPLETRKKIGFRGFRDTGFPEYFRDGGNQVNHFTAYFIMTHKYKNKLYKLKDLTSLLVHVHEWNSSGVKIADAISKDMENIVKSDPIFGAMRIGIHIVKNWENNPPDISLGYLGANGGYLVSIGVLTPIQFATQLHLFAQRPDLLDKMANPQVTPPSWSYYRP